MSKIKIRFGTRGSSLALAQTNIAIEALKEFNPDIECEVVILTTVGDKVLDKPLIEFGGKGVFVNEFEEALIRKEIDFAVHSAKDMPMELKEGLVISSVLKREDPRDVLITLSAKKLEGLKDAIIGTSSLRRQVQVESLMPNISCRSLRGNVNTRLKKLEDGQYDAIILAAAGLKRLNLDLSKIYHYRYFDFDELVPAGGQGIIAIEGRKDDLLNRLWEPVTDRKAELELEMERKALQLFSAGCQEPIGIFTCVEEREVTIWMMKDLGEKIVKRKERINLDSRWSLIERLVNEILEEI